MQNPPLTVVVLAVLLTGLALAGGCEDEPYEYPLDDVLRYQHIQALGTHNSYHVAGEGTTVEAWKYTHRPLDEQLGELGIRQFELDMAQHPDTGVFEVYHVPMLDEGTTCRELVECLSIMKAWSDDHPAHHPFMTLFEIKDGYDEETAAEVLATLDDEVTSVWPMDRLVTTDLVRGEHDSVLSAVQDVGWPTLGELRGRAMFVLHEGSGFRDEYTGGGVSAAGRPLFPDGGGDATLPYTAVHAMNDPVGGQDAIVEMVAANHLVRTRADADLGEAAANDTARLDAALSSGATFLSTDFPEPVDGYDYVADIPGGTPSRCNPVTAPPECTSEAIEHPEHL